ncbi:hypothetical protein P7K49_004429 [Saguinus oedipus]|uniref:Uncharacterized protein n=1 Tax=Saguinus oedipus TaxID=9490 RepID=A0ABQ9W7D6_SAGOE|nr:hypothetical protein P7K49_004429 [Saguinus oedipus]
MSYCGPHKWRVRFLPLLQNCPELDLVVLVHMITPSLRQLEVGVSVSGPIPSSGPLHACVWKHGSHPSLPTLPPEPHPAPRLPALGSLLSKAWHMMMSGLIG